MDFENRDMQGSIFHNNKKTERSPDMKGFVIVEGQRYWVSSWIRKSSKSGKTYQTLVLEKDENWEGL